MKRYEKIIFWFMVVLVLLLAVRSWRAQFDYRVVKYNQNEIIKSLLKAGIVEIDEDVRIQ